MPGFVGTTGKSVEKIYKPINPRDATPILHIRGANLQKQIHRYFSLKGPLIKAVESSFDLRSSANKVVKKRKGSKLFSNIFSIAP